MSAASAADLVGLGRPADEARDVARDRLDVGLELGVVLLVVGRVVADDVDDRASVPLRALCRLASPLPRPGPRCSSVAAGRSAMRPYPSAAPVATPSNSASTPRISGTASSAATKCISDVPGFMKHVSTPHATSVRISACAPFTVVSSLTSKMVPGLRMPCGSNAVLIRRIKRELHGVLERGNVRLLLRADAVLARDGAAERHPRGEDVADQVVPHLGVLLEHRQVHVAVAGVAAADDERSARRRELARPPPCTAGSTRAAPPCR